MLRDRLEFAARLVNQQIVGANSVATPAEFHRVMPRKTESPEIVRSRASLVQDSFQCGASEMDGAHHSLADASPESTPVELSEIEVPGLCDLRQLVHIVELVIDDERRSGFAEIRNGRFLMSHWK